MRASGAPYRYARSRQTCKARHASRALVETVALYESRACRQSESALELAHPTVCARCQLAQRAEVGAVKRVVRPATKADGAEMRFALTEEQQRAVKLIAGGSRAVTGAPVGKEHDVRHLESGLQARLGLDDRLAHTAHGCED